MVATVSSEDAELLTTRLRMTVSLALGWFYGVLPLNTFIPFYGLCFPFTDNRRPYILIWLHLWCGHSPLYWSRPFPIVLWCITLFSHDITPPLFLLIHLSHDPTFCLLIIRTLLIAFVSFRTGLLRVLTHTDSIVVQIPDVIYDLMTTPVYKISKCGGVTPQLWYLGKSSALLCLCVIKDKSELNE